MGAPVDCVYASGGQHQRAKPALAVEPLLLEMLL